MPRVGACTHRLAETCRRCGDQERPQPQTQEQQSPATNAVAAASARAQQQQQLTQPLNNQPVWSEVRAGTLQTTAVVGRETNVLIQTEGQTWRALRNSLVSVYAGWALIILVLVIAAFYFWKGTMRLHEPPTGRRIRRFTAWQMAIHWTTAWTFVALAFSGLIMTFGKNILLPLLGYTLFSWLTIFANNLHNFIGALIIGCIVLLYFTFILAKVTHSYALTDLSEFRGPSPCPTCPRRQFNAVTLTMS
mgnify:CR=1 FL=1